MCYNFNENWQREYLSNSNSNNANEIWKFWFPTVLIEHYNNYLINYCANFHWNWSTFKLGVEGGRNSNRFLIQFSIIQLFNLLIFIKIEELWISWTKVGLRDDTELPVFSGIYFWLVSAECLKNISKVFNFSGT